MSYPGNSQVNVRYFPKYLPDEVMCSLVGRYHIETLSSSFSNTKTELFGSRDVSIPIHFPTNLAAFEKRVGSLLRLSKNELITKLTLWDFFKKFIPKLSNLRRKS